jgi:hypothetical protein
MHRYAANSDQDDGQTIEDPEHRLGAVTKQCGQ